MFHKTQKILTAATLTLSFPLATTAIAQVINEDIKILAADGSETDSFGGAIVISNGVIAVGAPLESELGTFAGAAYLFDTSGNQLIKLLADDGEEWDKFGGAIDIDNGIVAIAASGYSDTTPYAIGAVYLFDADPLSPNFGNQIAQLIADDAGPTTRFAASVAIKDGIVAVGAPWGEGKSFNTGTVYLFDADPLSPNFGNQITKLSAIDGKNRDRFGTSVAIGDGMAAVGATEDDHDVHQQDAGSTYLFDIATGNQVAKILASDPVIFDGFGNALAIDNGILAVGASGVDQEDIGLDLGAVYLFDLGTQNQLIKLTAFDGNPIDRFGASVSLDNSVVAVGSTFGENENGSSSGAVYTYNADPLSKNFGTLITKMTASDGQSHDFFGNAIDFDNGIIVVGADSDDDLGTSSGSGYIYNTNITCSADFNSDGELDFFDASAFLDAFSDGDSTGDFNDDGNFNFFDVSAFLQAFTAGCP